MTGPDTTAAGRVAAWEASGERIEVDGHEIWWTARAAGVDVGNRPLLVLHGFPTCSYDWVDVLDGLCAQRRVVLVDQLGFGLSAKPDVRYSIRHQADVAAAVVAHLGLDQVDLLTHDMGDSIGGELLARSLDGDLGFGVGRRVITNGSIYLDLAHLTDGQNLLLGLPDARFPGLGADGGAAFRAGVSATFAPTSAVDPTELEVLGELALRNGGLELLPRTLRYIADRRLEESRYTGAIEAHPSPLSVIWGDQDPVAVVAMAHQLVARRPHTPLTVLEGVGHYPMVEAPEAFAGAVVDALGTNDNEEAQ